MSSTSTTSAITTNSRRRRGGRFAADSFEAAGAESAWTGAGGDPSSTGDVGVAIGVSGSIVLTRSLWRSCRGERSASLLALLAPDVESGHRERLQSRLRNRQPAAL